MPSASEAGRAGGEVAVRGVTRDATDRLDVKGGPDAIEGYDATEG